ncbi:cell division protein FtsQ/DivIB [Parvularcula sp. LCG005]|uniref:cell division protein FtsQ/DivIB n=1 Tax=Parvularcula sp. LCG005 TaxID=3078805 RepID=UPI00294276ED|nr:FtsQ-type POTRA domain-containing protein [Parvularcula sp. LCG005]WOI52119.1 FtsQ-type POTRA domain-containing protein [Parvularcula sp. LCG005]
MPPVKGKTRAKKPAAKKKSSARSKTTRTRSKTATTGFGGRLQALWSGVVTYSVVGITALALVVLFMLFAGGYFWNIGDRIDTLTGRATKAMGFSVSRVTLKGADEISDREIMDALGTVEKGSVLGQPLLTVDANAARQRIEELGWVKAAAVQKLWPNTIHVSVIERAPQALWQDRNDRFHLIDRDGHPLRQVALTDYTTLPVLSGTENPANAKDLLLALERRPELYARVATIISVSDRRYDLRFRNNFTAKLPDEDVDAALDRLIGLGAGTGKLASSLDYIDLRDPKWAYFRPKSS